MYKIIYLLFNINMYIFKQLIKIKNTFRKKNNKIDLLNLYFDL